ncbi:MAG: CDGSH iron-sulfur domain-containing protein [SAR324 cluster bacterium]|nr:CDGSH iron-sulfur domain-containing protein [SAR324 cluster bacterium]
MNENNDSKIPAIECRSNGPYIVAGTPKLRNSKSEEISTKKIYALCRCGGSANKPFCDGTHSRIGFSGARLKEDEDDGQEKYAGQRITILDNRGICAHSGFCTDKLSEVFKLGKEPWIDPDGAEAEAIVNAVRECPSGALNYEIDGVERDSPAQEPMITVSENGPYRVVGGLDLNDEVTGQQPRSSAKYSLCRCGQSKNKPFCDGEHWNVNFQDDKN